MKRFVSLYVILVLATLAMIITSSLQIGNERMPGRIYQSNIVDTTAVLVSGGK